METLEASKEFLGLLGKSGLLPLEKINFFVSRYGLREMTAANAAETLIKEGLLTRYQAERLLDGNHRGLVIDGYKILYMLGSGGMGYVYAAEEPDSQWDVALKILAENLRKDRGAISRFQLEAQAGMRLVHPNIARTIAIKQTEDIYGKIHYVVMELIQGVSLVELLEIRRPISYQRAADIIMQVAEGLYYAHGQGLIHRDIKPENLLIRSNGSVKILDFGLAMLDENGEEFTMAMIHGQNCVGTADFIAPEQSIDSYHVDQRADIYSLGCTLYSALTCKVPFPSKSVVEKLEGHRKRQPRPLQELRPDVPESLTKIILKMMAKRREDRFSSAVEVAHELKPFAKRKPVDFDFENVLAKRARRAERRRLKRLLQEQGAPVSESSIAGSASVISGRLRPSSLETVVGQDTRMERTIQTRPDLTPKPREKDSPAAE